MITAFLLIKFITNILNNKKTMNINENKQSSNSQNALIRAWLKAGKTLTSLEALNLFGCMRLASRINDLRKQGLNIHTERIMTTTGKRVTRYSIL